MVAIQPRGYVLTTGGGLGREWFAVFLSWLAKLIILRIGGVKLYRQAVLFFRINFRRLHDRVPLEHNWYCF